MIGRPETRRRRWALRVAAPVAALLVTTLAAPPASSTADTLLSAGRPATASSIEASGFEAAKAVDGNASTRWASTEGHDPEWIRVDLGGTYSVSRVKLTWEAAYAKSYRIQTSPDGSAWTDVYATTSGNGGTDDLTVTGTGRYVRVYGTARGTSYGYSLYELEVYGGGSGGDTTPPSAPTGLHVTGTTSASVSLAWTASTDNVGVTGYQVYRDGTQVATVPGTSYTDSGLTPSTGHAYTVRARDAAGNQSAASASVTRSRGARLR